MVETVNTLLVCVNLVKQVLTVFPKNIEHRLHLSVKYQPSVLLRKRIITPCVDNVLKYNAVSVRKISISPPPLLAFDIIINPILRYVKYLFYIFNYS